MKGKAERPVYLYLKEGKAEIREATRLWGKDGYETQKVIREKLKDDSVSVACIGSAGEGLIKFASIMNDRGRAAAGRCGLGALMGSKNLKAVAACGNLRPELAHPDKVRELAQQTVAQINGHLVSVAFGPLFLNTDLDSIVRANHLCNTHGLDTISVGVSIAYAFYLYHLGILKKRQVGFELQWGDGDAVVKLLEKIITQKGIGKILSQSTLAMAQEFGRDPDEAAQVKGLEVPMHDGRAFHGLALTYATGPRGACHLKGDYYNVDLGNLVVEYMILPSERLS